MSAPSHSQDLTELQGKLYTRTQNVKYGTKKLLVKMSKIQAGANLVFNSLYDVSVETAVSNNK